MLKIKFFVDKYLLLHYDPLSIVNIAKINVTQGRRPSICVRKMMLKRAKIFRECRDPKPFMWVV